MQYDIEKARKMYRGLGYLEQGIFCEYSPAYVVTNEQYRPILDFLSPKNKTVLATMGSGDWPLYYHLFGAKSVDAFDISYCANAMFHFKKSAIKHMNLDQYYKMLLRLPNNADLSPYKDIINECPKDVRNFINGMQGCHIFAFGCVVDKQELITESEYNTLKNQIDKINVPFIWSALDSLYGKLKKSYDVIYLSNILQYEQSDDMMLEIINSLRPYLNKDGIMIVCTAGSRLEEHRYGLIDTNVKNWANTMKIDNAIGHTFLLQKTR